jgi:hypothetical protein
VYFNNPQVFKAFRAFRAFREAEPINILRLRKHSEKNTIASILTLIAMIIRGVDPAKSSILNPKID